MINSPSKPKKLISISETADFLGVSIDTVRRWDKSNVLHSQRPDGKNRYFSLEELEQFKLNQPLSISEVAVKLGVSATTLRRLETRGLIKPERNNAGERVYDADLINNLLNNEYFLRKKQLKELVHETRRQEEKHIDTTVLGIQVIDFESAPQPKRRINEFITVTTVSFMLLFALGIRNVWINEFTVQAKAPQEAIPSQVLAETKYQELEIAAEPVEEAPQEPEIAVEPVSEATPEAVTEEIAKQITEETTDATAEGMLTKIVIVKVAGESSIVNIHEKATIESRKIGEARNGELFELVGVGTNWYEVKLVSGEAGFIPAQYIIEEGN